MSCLGGPDYEDSVLFRTCYGADIVIDPFAGSRLTGCWPL
jgi:DNA modification methylase